MLLGEIIAPELVTLDLKAANKFEAIEQLIDVAIQAGAAPTTLREHLIDVVIKRERSISTGMERGIALPHGTSDQMEAIVGVLGISKEGIPFDSLDGLPARLVILLILPEHRVHVHVRTLAGIAYLIKNTSFRDALLEAIDTTVIMQLISEEEKKEIFDQFRG